MADYHPNGGREQIHLPGPSLLPLSTAVGVTVGLLGLVYSWWFVLAGGVVVLISALRWIRAVRVEIDSLPTERR
jgi:ABC-type transport system involved in Fe-S cluster assembly fused permease/ATPase subunit